MTEHSKEKIYTAMAQHRGVPHIELRLSKEKLTKPAGYQAFWQNFSPTCVMTIHGLVAISK